MKRLMALSTFAALCALAPPLQAQTFQPSVTVLHIVRIFDGGGRTLVPGLIDMHWHTMLARPAQTCAQAGRLLASGCAITGHDNDRNGARGCGLTWQFLPTRSLDPEILYIRDQSNTPEANHGSSEVWITLRKDF